MSLRYNLQFFADGPGGEKTEPATHKKLSDARDRGQVAKSREIANGFGLLALFLLIKLWVGNLGGQFLQLFSDTYNKIPDIVTFWNGNLPENDMRLLFRGTIIETIIILAPVFIVAFVVAFVLKSSMSAELLKIGMATLFAGGYMIFDVMMVYLLDELLVVNTYGRQLCMMLAVYFLGLIIRDSLKGRKKKIASVMMAISGLVNAGLITIVNFGQMLMFDTQFYWVVSQFVLCPVLLVLCVLGLREDKRVRCM